MISKGLISSLLLMVLAGPVATASAETIWTAIGPEGGNVVSLAVAPGGVVWAGAGREGGLFRSSNQGSSWSRSGGSLALTSVPAVVVDPSRPSTVYAGTRNNGVLRTTDGGATWTQASQGLPRHEVEGCPECGVYDTVLELEIDRRDPRRLFAATFTGLYRSVDRGASWELLRDHGVYVLAVAPSDARFLYALAAAGAVRSRDGGRTWEPMDFGSHRDGVSLLAVHPTRPEQVWAANTDGRFGGPVLLRSTDGGLTWDEIPVRRAVRSLAFDPREPDTLWAGVEGGIVRVFDAGARWRFFPVSAGEGVISLAFDPANRRILYAGTGWNDSRSSAGSPGRQGGVWRSSDRGRTWRQINRGLLATEIETVTAPAPGRIVAAVTGRGPMIRTGAWRPGNQGIEPVVNDLLADPSDPAVLWAATWNGVFRSEDGGRTWTRTSGGLTGSSWLPDSLVFSSLAIDPSVPGGLWTAGWGGLFHSSDRGETWARVESLPGRLINSVAVDPADPRAIWVGSGGSGEVFPAVFHSEDGGATWQETNFAVYGDLKVAVGPTGTVFATSLGTLLRSEDGGVTWDEEGMSTIVVAPDPRNPESVWAGTYGGLRHSQDGGATWESVPGGPEDGVILDLAWEAPGRLLVATRGRGLFRLVEEAPATR